MSILTKKHLAPALLFAATAALLIYNFSSSSSAQNSVVPANQKDAALPRRSGQRPDNKQCPTCPAPTQQTIYAPTIGPLEAAGSQIVLNSRSPKVMEVSPTFYMSDGTAILGEKIQLQPAEIRFVDIKKLIPVGERGRRQWGGMSLVLCGQGVGDLGANYSARRW
ncbi:MAG: hypothetical protein ACR2G4_09310 [Pyrinomonadaceae bacterium]